LKFGMPRALISSFFDPATFTVTHLVADVQSRRAAIIDSVLDYDARSACTSTQNADAVIDAVRAQGLTIDWLLETHAHADHLSAAPYLKQQLGGTVAIGSHIRDVQSVFRKLFNSNDIAVDGSPFERLFDDGESLQIGALELRVMHTPGHTPGCVSYCLETDDGIDVFVGDTLFMPDYGSARCDFPGGDASALFRSMRKLLALPPQTRLHLCHDYPPVDRAPRWVSTVAEQRRDNIHVRDGIEEAAFVAMRNARDKTLGKPTLLLPAIQVNVRAGHWPAAESNGVSYLKIPLNAV
jgi:glyoxylase-like metal-dependent hydrolase (beta-lactamase superfamily II)